MHSQKFGQRTDSEAEAAALNEAQRNACILALNEEEDGALTNGGQTTDEPPG